jgi:glycosyltransferase involved in cell wall biosynthesis
MISVIVPVFNEEGNILNVINKIRQSISTNDEIIVVDDGSIDNTVSEVKKSNCILIENKINKGKGQSLINGLNKSKGNIVVFIDGDGQDDPRELHKLIGGINKGYDFVIGSRFIPEENNKKKRYDQRSLSPVNFLGNKALTFLINKLFSLNIYDSQSGFKCFRKEKINKLNLISMRYEIETEIIIKSKKHNLKILEVPVYRYERQNGLSSLFDIPFGRLKFTLKVIKVIVYGFIYWR